VNWRKSSILRKSVALAQEPGRRWRAWRATEADYRAHPPVICNSFPKSGTHLLVQVLEALPGVTNRGAFLASIPSVTFRERSPEAMAARIQRIGPGELVSAHLHHHPLCAEALRRKNAVHYFIYRDLRDVAISEAYYLTNMNRWHRLHRYYRGLPDDHTRIAWAITGEKDPAFPFDYPDIGQRFARFHPWLSDPSVCTVRFEDLVGPQRRTTIERIVRHYLDAAKMPADDLASLVSRAESAIDPRRSHTFRSGKSGGWRHTLTDEHIRLIDAVAGTWLRQLGYATDGEGEALSSSDPPPAMRHPPA